METNGLAAGKDTPGISPVPGYFFCLLFSMVLGGPGGLYALEIETARSAAAAFADPPALLRGGAGPVMPAAILSPELIKEDYGYAAGNYTGKAVSAAARLDPAGSGLVMLQGFHWYADDYWYKPPRGWWGVLSQKALDVAAAGFGLVWFPPVSVGSYYPREWYNLDSQWGKKPALVEAVNAMHTAGVKVLADIVLNHRNGSTNWLDFRSPDWPSDAVVNDDEVWAQSPYAALPRSRYGDEGQGDFGARDLDHRNPLVQEDAKKFLRWLRNDVGFDGWRYDMVKGYPARYVGMYNAASAPLFSVGEYYDTDRQRLADWVDGTSAASSVFDFTTRYALAAAVESEQYGPLSDNGRPSGLIGWWPAKSVTFIENHDTSPRDPGFLAGAPAEYRSQRLMAYAYLLTHPGVPCVFWPHYFDWGAEYRGAIRRLMDIRRKAGITSVSPVSVLAASNGLYASVTEGGARRVALKLGKNWGWTPGDGWTLAASGERYAVWIK